MVDITQKTHTLRTARARATIHLGLDVLGKFSGNDVYTAKGGVFQTAIIAGTMAAKRTHELIPFCHQLLLEDCQLKIEVADEAGAEGCVWIEALVKLNAPTGAEMEAMTAVSVAALTVYDMCKSINKRIEIKEIVLLEKTGGKSHFKR